MPNKKNQPEKLLNSPFADELIATVVIVNAKSLFLATSTYVNTHLWLVA